MIYFILGAIIGLLINPAKEKIIRILHEYKEREENKETAEFYEPLSQKEKFEQAKNVNQLLDN